LASGLLTLGSGRKKHPSFFGISREFTSKTRQIGFNDASGIRYWLPMTFFD
jgi:hypothetical protein